MERELGIDHKTVRKYVYAEAFPERAKRNAGRSILDPYLVYADILFMRTENALDAEEQELMQRIRQDATARQVYNLTRQFVQIMCERTAEQLDGWLEASKASGITILQNFASSLAQDYEAVRAALETAWSNGQTEGQNTRLKLIKRQMYGRAKFDLLRQRVLFAA